MRRFFGLGLCLALIGAIPGSAKAQNLVVNGGFETGDFTGWTLSDSTYTSVTSTPAFVHSGNYGVAYGFVGGDNFLYQTITTTPGESYTFQFFQKTVDGTPNDFQAYWGGNLILDVPNSPNASNWTDYTFTEMATGTSTEIKFGFRQDPGYSAFDDVSVTPASVPEPASFIMLGTAGAALLALGRRRARRSVPIAV